MKLHAPWRAYRSQSQVHHHCERACPFPWVKRRQKLHIRAILHRQSRWKDVANEQQQFTSCRHRGTECSEWQAEAGAELDSQFREGRTRYLCGSVTLGVCSPPNSLAAAAWPVGLTPTNLPLIPMSLRNNLLGLTRRTHPRILAGPHCARRYPGVRHNASWERSGRPEPASSSRTWLAVSSPIASTTTAVDVPCMGKGCHSWNWCNGTLQPTPLG